MTRSLDPSPPLRLWPGVLIAVLALAARLILPLVVPDGKPYGVLALVAGSLLILLWWLFFSRARWSERLGAVALIAVALGLTYLLVDESIATGMMGFMLPFYGLPTAAFALVAWAVMGRNLAPRTRWASLAVILLLVCGSWTLVRTGGFTGGMDHDFAWRWAATPEERMLAQTEDEEMVPLPSAPAPAAGPGMPPDDVREGDVGEGDVGDGDDATPEPVATPESAALGAETVPAPVAAPATLPATPPGPASRLGRVTWAGFRGPDRAGAVTGTHIATDWKASPPAELWRRPIGPGWSSFAVAGDVLFTQEQRGEHEVVSAYRLSTGEPIWRHEDQTRFWESNAGAGPRGTPTLAHGRVYTVGANGLVNALDATTGAAVWSHDAAAQTGAKLPIWGFSSSPLVVGDAVLVAMSGDLLAYDAATGRERWSRDSLKKGDGYSSPQLARIGGREQVLLVEPAGVVGLDPADGSELWRHEWPGYPIVQPAQTAEGDVLFAVNEQSGLRRLAVAQTGSDWTVEERWTSRGLKPYFNDFVVHEGHAYGFDGRILSCIDLATGERQWKGGRYGNGQMLLLADQDLLLLLSETGELALVRATPAGFEEVAAPIEAIDGKTWNHPVLVGDVLLVRNGQEMAAFRLSEA